MVRIDGILVFCEVPSAELKKAHPDIENEYRNFLARLKEVSEGKGLKFLVPYFTRNHKEYYFRGFTGIEETVFFADEIGLKRMCMVANMGTLPRRIIGRKRSVILVCNGHDDEKLDLISEKLKLPKEYIVEVMLENGEFGFRDSVQIVDLVCSQTSH